MAGSKGSSLVPSLPPPRPKSPPEYPDLYGKRRELAKVQMLEREIGFLQEELKSVEGLQPASRCCKEVADFVVANSDPFLPITQKIHRPCHFWKWLCGMSCFSISWSCCCCDCSHHWEMPQCCNCNICNCLSCLKCSLPKCNCSCSWPQHSQCFKKFSCSGNCGHCCIPKCSKCPDCSCSRSCTCCCPKCTNVVLCCHCTRNCCYRCYLCY